MIPLACKQSKARAMSRAKDKARGRSRRWGRMLVRYLRRDIPGSNSVTITIKGSLQAPMNFTRLWCLTRDIILTSRMKRLWRDDLSSGLLPRFRTFIATIREPYLTGKKIYKTNSKRERKKKEERGKAETFLDRLCRERLRQSWSRWTTTLDPPANSPLSSIPSLLRYYSFCLSLSLFYLSTISPSSMYGLPFHSVESSPTTATNVFFFLIYLVFRQSKGTR